MTKCISTVGIKEAHYEEIRLSMFSMENFFMLKK
jgi:hypothetical protein